MTAMPVLTLLPPFVLGWLAVETLLPAPAARPRWAAGLMKASLGFGFGAGLSSSLYFLFRLAGIDSGAAIVSAEVALCLLAAGLVVKPKRLSVTEPPPGASAFPWSGLLGIAVLACAALVFLAAAAALRANPHGEWDAWSIWNLRAKFLAAPGDAWRYAFSPLLERTHPYYPLLLSGLVARCWKVAGQTSPSAPAVAALAFQFAVLGLLVSSGAILRSAAAGMLAGLVLLAGSGFLLEGPNQYADVPLSLYILGALSMLLWPSVFDRDRKPALLLAGAFGAFGAWTKNEGMLFFLILLVLYPLVERRGCGWKEAARRWGFVALGSAPVMCLALYFKFFLAPGSAPFLSPSLSENLARLTAGRLIKVASAFLGEAWRWGGGWTHPALLVALLAAVLRFHPDASQKRWAALAGLSLAALLATFFATYWMTRLDLDWLLSTSLRRLYAQVWPAAVLLAFVVLRRPEDTAGVLPARVSRKEKARRG